MEPAWNVFAAPRDLLFNRSAWDWYGVFPTLEEANRYIANSDISQFGDRELFAIQEPPAHVMPDTHLLRAAGWGLVVSIPIYVLIALAGWLIYLEVQ